MPKGCTDRRISGLHGSICRPAARGASMLMVTAALLAGGCASQPPISEDALNGDEIRSLITGNTLEGSYLADRLVMVFYADGVVRGSMGLTGSDSGTWEIDGNSYCNEWDRYFGGDHRCYQWHRQGDGFILENVDSFKTQPIRGRIVKGKPKGY